MTAIATQDPMVVLAEQVKRQAAEEKVADRVSKAKAALWLDWRKADATFWAALAIRLDWKPSWEPDTACTDGKNVWVNPEFFDGCSDAEAVGLVVHETGHPALQHLVRFKEGKLEPRVANEAADLVLNPLLLSAGFTLPACRIMPGEGPYKGMPKDLSMEMAYRWLMENRQQQGGEKGEGQGDGEGGQGDDPGQCGGFTEPGDGTEAAVAEQKANWEVAVAQAHNAAKMRGTLSAGLERMAQEILNPRTNVWEVIRQFLHKSIVSDNYQWMPPNRRFVWNQVYLPSRKLEGGGELVVMCDLSGSISNDIVTVFAECVEGLGQVFPGLHCTVLYHDSDVTHVQEWSPSEGPFLMEPKGGGGTSHVEVFKWVDDHEIECDACVCLTDMASVFPKDAPRFPVLWASTVKNVKPPFGMIVDI